MPGNPLPKIEINASRWPYDQNGPSNGKFGEVAVTPAPKAVFDANSLAPLAGLASGHVQVSDDSQTQDMPNELVPNGGGDRGWSIDYRGKPGAAQDSQAHEINYALTIPARHTWDYFRIWQPDNYTQRRYCYFRISDLSLVSDWQVGDTVESSTTGVGVIYEFNTTEGDDPRVYIEQYYGGHPENTFGSGKTITNQRTSTSVTSQGSGIQGENAKQHIRWVDDTEFNGGGHNGYSNGAMSMDVDQASLEGDDLSGNGFSAFKIATSANGNPTVGERYNEIGQRAIFYDKADNGSWVNFVIEFKRSSGEGINDAEFRLWKKTEREGGDYPNWTLVFESTGQYVWSPYQDNKFTHGYLFGNKNGSYIEDTVFYLNRWGYWTQKPTFLTEAGV